METVLDIDPISSTIAMYEWLKLVSEATLKSEGTKIILNYPNDFKFDLILFDVTLGLTMMPLVNKFNNPPVVGVTPFLLPPILANTMGNDLQTAYLPYYLFQYTNRMNFFQRLRNLIQTYCELWYRKYNFVKHEERLMKKYFGTDTVIEDFERNITLLLSNTDPILDYPAALPPNIIPIGGMHIQPARPLPKVRIYSILNY